MQLVVVMAVRKAVRARRLLQKKALLSNGKSAFSILFSVDGNLAFQPCGSSGTGSGDGFSWIMMCLISG